MDIKAAVAVAFVAGAGAGSGAVKLLKSEEFHHVVWRNDHVWATGKSNDAGIELAIRRCSDVIALDGGVLAQPCDERVLGQVETSCFNEWLRCSK